MINFIRFVFFVGLFLTAQAYSAIMIEPAIGTNLGYKLTNATQSHEFSGTGVGGRLGLDYLGVMFGLDHFMHTGDMEFNNVTKDAKITETGLFVGYDAPVLFRVWATMLMSGDVNVTGGNKFEGGSGFKFGGSLTMLPFIAINLEYRQYEWDEVNGVAASEKFANKGMFLSVSLPLSF